MDINPNNLAPQVPLEPSAQPPNPAPHVTAPPPGPEIPPRPLSTTPGTAPAYATYNNFSATNHMVQPVAELQNANNPAVIILQWLTYAFWGWTVLAMSFLVSTVMANFLGKVDTGEVAPYAIASVIVLLPISLICDFFYSKKEPLKKTGAASIVMVIHAVLFALFGIGAIITAVFSLVSLFVSSSSDTKVTKAFLFSALIIAVLYAAVFIRTLRPHQLPFVRKVFPIFMSAVVGLFIVLAIIGPIAWNRATRNDRLIERNASNFSTAINKYYAKQRVLPNDLNAIDLNEESKQIIAKQLVTYKANTKNVTTESLSKKTSSQTVGRQLYNLSGYYQLCFTFKDKDPSGSNRYFDDLGERESSYVSVYGHGAGQQCYNLVATTSAF